LDLEQVWEAEWERNLLAAALERLKARVTPAQFEIFYLHVLREQPVRAVAAALDVTAAQVYLARHRIGRLLKREVQRLRRSAK
jgi:RNA polymerase sigma-70 factor (ECF subfamily)